MSDTVYEEDQNTNLLSTNHPTLARSIHDLLKGNDVSIRALPRNLERTCTKRGFHFNLLIAGRYDLGQEELVETLFGVKLTDHYTEHQVIKEDNVSVVDGPVRLHLKVLTTPNFGTRLNDTGSYKPIVKNVQDRLLRHLHIESQLYRKKTTADERIHLCLYLLPPSGLLMHPNDIQCLSRLTGLCNVIPIIARSDMLTRRENAERKLNIHDILKDLNTFDLPEGDIETDEEEWIDHLQKIKQRQPFACMVQNEYMGDERYPDYDANESSYSDTGALRAAIIAHMCELVDSTNFTHYEEFRARTLMERHNVRSARQDHIPRKHEIEDVDNAMYTIRQDSAAY